MLRRKNSRRASQTAMLNSLTSSIEDLTSAVVSTAPHMAKLNELNVQLPLNKVLSQIDLFDKEVSPILSNLDRNLDAHSLVSAFQQEVFDLEDQIKNLMVILSQLKKWNVKFQSSFVLAFMKRTACASQKIYSTCLPRITTLVTAMALVH